MAEVTDYKTPQSSINRLRKRGQYDFGTIHSLIDACPVLHVSFNAPSTGGSDDEDACPVILPMLGATGNYADPDGDASAGPRSIYLHGHSAARMFKKPASAAGEEEGAGADASFAVCVAATFVDGLVLTYTPFHNSCNYRSAVCFGRATPVTDEGERDYALTVITDNMLPGRWAESRPPSRAELTSTGILRVEVRAASAKLRTGSTSEDRKDLKDDGLRERVWVGVVPAAQAWGTPVPSVDNKVAKLPEYIASHIESQNRDLKKYAEDAIHISS